MKQDEEKEESKDKKPDKTKYWAISGAIVMVLLLIITLFSGYKPKEPGKYDALVECLAADDVHMYGAYWCTHCQNQKDKFGDSWEKAVELGVYIECDPKGDNPQSELCLKRGIKGYPTWHIPDPNNETVTFVMPGESELYDLAETSGCLAALGGV